MGRGAVVFRSRYNKNEDPHHQSDSSAFSAVHTHTPQSDSSPEHIAFVEATVPFTIFINRSFSFTSPSSSFGVFYHVMKKFLYYFLPSLLLLLTIRVRSFSLSFPPLLPFIIFFPRIYFFFRECGGSVWYFFLCRSSHYALAKLYVREDKNGHCQRRI